MIGRKKEIEQLNRLYNSKKSELVAIYGRRRVGKTYLIDETFEGRITFRHAGLSPVEIKTGLLKAQLKNFYNSLLDQGMKKSKMPGDWLDAFFMLEQFLKERDDGSRQVVFLDELPWLDTQRSGFLTAFESFWNNWACHRKNIMVIVTGSASSWILDNLINNHGGLYNRVTYEIKLSPFTLNECEEFFESIGVNLTRYDITQSYMIFGGIPYYLGYFEKGKSLSQMVDQIMFSKEAVLRNEYDRLFISAFSNPETMKKIVNFLSTKNSGYTRAEICKGINVSDGGTLTTNLEALIASDYIVKYYPFGLSRRTEYYKLVDPFCLFCSNFKSVIGGKKENFWSRSLSAQNVVVWRGFAFERVCFSHIKQIKSALEIGGVLSSESAWSYREKGESGAQIDMLIDRDDNVINMCEIKFSGDDFEVDLSCYKDVLKKQEALTKLISPKTAIHNTLITTFGLKENKHSGVFSNVITLDDLFK